MGALLSLPLAPELETQEGTVLCGDTFVYTIFWSSNAHRLEA
jgi:hypothetical protein